MQASFREICLEGLPGPIGAGRCLVIGEVAQTHDGSLGQAHAFIDAIANAGADAVKFQTHIASAESTANEPWRVKFSLQDESRYDYWCRMEFSAEQWAGLKEHAESRGLLFMSSPFSPESVELLRKIGQRVWKVASGEVGNLLLLELIAETGDPVILSSGMSGWNELDKAVEIVQKSGNDLAVLQCTSSYPCPPEQIGLNLLDELKERYGCSVGLSDHSGVIFPGMAAATLGAAVLEVHLTLSREMFGPDVPSSITTAELKQMVEGIRFIERALDNPVEKEDAAKTLAPLRKIFTKSIYSNAFLPKGTVLGKGHIQLKKPGNGIPAAEVPNVVGRKLRRNVEPGEMILIEDLEA